MMYKYSFVVLCSIFLFSCKSLNYPSGEILSERELLRSKRSSFVENWDVADLSFDKYYGNITQDVSGANYYPIWFDSIGNKMDGVIFEPENPSSGTVLMIHGYAGNIRGFRYIIAELLRNNYRVAALSLPGHGLAEGERGDIETFDDYGTLVNDFVTLLRSKSMEPMYAVGHSTGATSLIIYNEMYGWNFDKVLFIAPLIRSVSWYPARFVRFLSKPFVNYFNTEWSGPLAVQVFPLHWFDKLVLWNNNFINYEVFDDEILLLQGEKDNVVLWKYNVPAIKKIYPNSEVVKYSDGTHTMFMSDEGVGVSINNQILKYIKKDESYDDLN